MDVDVDQISITSKGKSYLSEKNIWLKKTSPSKKTLIYFHSKIPMLNIKTKLEGNHIYIFLSYDNNFTHLRDRIFKPIILPKSASQWEKDYRAAEQMLSYDLKESFSRFSQLLPHYSIKSWAQLRLADINFLMGQQENESICHDYQNIIKKYTAQTPAILAWFRQDLMNCPADKNNKIEDINPEPLTRHISLDDPIANMMREEVIFSLLHTQNSHLILSILPYAPERFDIHIYRKLSVHFLSSASWELLAKTGPLLLQEIRYHPETVHLIRFVAFSQCYLQMKINIPNEKSIKDDYWDTIKSCNILTFKANKEDKSETPVDDSSFRIKMIYLKKRIEKIKKGIKNEKR
jgi:hypothetical protein